MSLFKNSCERNLFPIVIFFAMVGVAGCFSDNKTATQINPYRCGDSIHSHVNDTFSVKLRTGVGTPFRWELSDSLDMIQLTVTNPPPIIPVDSTLDGGYGHQWFRFKVLKAGSANINFKFRGTFGNNAQSKDSCRVYLSAH